MHPSQSTISPETAKHVLYHFGHGGTQPGNFARHLLDTILLADSFNLARLANAYPAEVAAVRLAKYAPRGIEALQSIADEYASVTPLRLVEVGL